MLIIGEAISVIYYDEEADLLTPRWRSWNSEIFNQEVICLQQFLAQ